LTLRAATPQDFAWIRSLAQRPEYAAVITDEDEAALAGYLARPDCRLLIWHDDAPRGFALFCGIGAPHARVELRRLALAEAGRGAGPGFVQRLIDYAFQELNAAGLWLDASGENLRAQRIYERAGFTLEGRQRAHWYRPSLGRAVDLMLYGLQREEWQARNTLAAPLPASYILPK
jgi:RimJ/RimL family protein N-acetyltransferase